MHASSRCTLRWRLLLEQACGPGLALPTSRSHVAYAHGLWLCSDDGDTGFARNRRRRPKGLRSKNPCVSKYSVSRELTDLRTAAYKNSSVPLILTEEVITWDPPEMVDGVFSEDLEHQLDATAEFRKLSRKRRTRLLYAALNAASFRVSSSLCNGASMLQASNLASSGVGSRTSLCRQNRDWWILANFVSGVLPALLSAVVDVSVIPPLIDVLQNTDFKIREGCWAISNATFDHLVAQGCIKALCDILTMMDNKVVQVTSDGLENILKRQSRRWSLVGE
ncbi:hypothetical protein DFH06DRAFT_1364969 [Mycena polygramma]|nr:hypothetical protein DFH06DRAFT_1364969 [Mycena polygramma]